MYTMVCFTVLQHFCHFTFRFGIWNRSAMRRRMRKREVATQLKLVCWCLWKKRLLLQKCKVMPKTHAETGCGNLASLMINSGERPWSGITFSHFTNHLLVIKRFLNLTWCVVEIYRVKSLYFKVIGFADLNLPGH